MAVGFRRFGADMAGIATRLWMCLVGWLMLGLLLPFVGGAAGSEGGSAAATTSSGALPLDITAEQIEYLQEQEIYEADGSVVVNQGTLRLTADHMTIQALPGVLIATGHVRLTDPKADLASERLELNVNTEAGVVTHGRVYLKSTNTSVEGRLIQRFSEDHYRVKEGRFTNCDAQKGETPAWRFEFKDLDLNAGDNVAFTGGWLCVNDVPVIPIPTLTYPLSKRHTGFLIPVVGWDSRFGVHVKESFFWAINPSQDLTISPFYYSDLGYGSDLTYRYILDRKSRGQWFVSALHQTDASSVSGASQTGQDTEQNRALIRGTHIQQFTPDLLLRVQANLVTDRNYLQQLSNSGVAAGPSQRRIESFCEATAAVRENVSARSIPAAVAIGGPGYISAFAGNWLQSPESLSCSIRRSCWAGIRDFVNFYREQGFTQDRIDVLPGLSTDVLRSSATSWG